MNDQDINVDAIADQVLPLDGPDTPERVIAAAALASELIRRLNHATLPRRVPTSLPYPEYADRVLASLQTLTSRLPQLARQIGVRLRAWAVDPHLGVDEMGPPTRPAAMAMRAAVAAAEAGDATGLVTAAFTAAAHATTRLTYRSTP